MGNWLQQKSGKVTKLDGSENQYPQVTAHGDIYIPPKHIHTLSHIHIHVDKFTKK